MNTSATALQVVKITAGGNPVKNRLAPFFGAYKYFKLGPVSVRFVPASTLPVDLLDCHLRRERIRLTLGTSLTQD